MMMKTYVFSGYFLNGSGRLFSLSDWSFDDHNFYDPHSREFRGIDCVDFDFATSRASMSKVTVQATSLKQALSHLRFTLFLNDLSVVLSAMYDCFSDGRKSSRLIRFPLDDV